MDDLKQEMLAFAQSLSGMPPLINQQEEEKRDMIPVDYRPLVSEPYRGKSQNVWVIQIYEAVVRLLKDVTPENTPVMEQRFNKLKRDYYELKNKPSITTAGINSQYERAYNKKYYY
jgi:hypothetical protein